MRKRVYICGPMAGYPHLNRDAFEAAAELIHEQRDAAVIPHDIPPFAHEGECAPVYGDAGREGVHDSGCYLRADIAEMVRCDVIYRLPGWSRSRGARIESAIAVMLHIPIIDAPDVQDDPTSGAAA